MNSMLSDDPEALFLRSLDSEPEEKQRRNLSALMEEDHKFRAECGQFLKIRALLLRKESDSLGPFFAERVIHQIKMMRKEIEYQIFFFFKKYQLVAVGVVVALLVLNILLSSQMTLKSILGLEEDTIEDIIRLDVYNDLTE